ncbi:hypothetical protein LTR74_019009, partial [Friedmanniomyces endolithicus]
MNLEKMFYFNVTAPHTNLSAYLNTGLGKTFAVNNTIGNDLLNVLSLLTVGTDPSKSLVYVPEAHFVWENATYDTANTSS